MFARVQYRGHFIDYHQTPQTLFADYYCQYTSNVQNAFPSDRYVLEGRWLGINWNKFYGDAANNLGQVLSATDPVENPGFETMHAIAQVWKVIIYERMANYWGPIPYSQVNNAESAVPYDSEEDIYKSFFTTLDAAVAVLNANAGGNAYGDNDQVYKGDIDKWITFANTLRLRIALRISDVEPDLAQAEAEKAVAAGVMLSNEDDALFQCTANSVHPIPRYLPWTEFRMSATMESVLNGYNDPRMPFMYSPAKTDGAYRGMRNGYEIVDLGGIPELTPNNLSDYGPRYMPVSVQDNLPYEIMLSPEAYFCRAEGALKGWSMGGTAEELYNKGIEVSMGFWEITDPDVISAYQQSDAVPIATWDAPTPVSTIPVRFDATDDAVALEQIHTQKWIGLFPDGWEAWASQRRADLPKRYPIMASENPDVGVNDMMRRVAYVAAEYNVNADAVTDAISKLGGPDKGSTRLWWDPQ
jgi:hypothetical protein